jgi:hypothetical protein
MNPIKKPTPVLREVLIQFSVEQDIPDQQLLDSYIERYPQFESQLRALASELMEGSLSENGCADETDAIDPLDIEKASVYASAFQTRYFEETGRVFGDTQGDTRTIENQLSSLDRPAYRSLAARLGINTLMLNQLRDREIDVRTIPQRFMKRLADEFNATVEVVSNFLNLPPAVSQMASFRSDDKPHSESKESFKEALIQSGLDEEQIKSLLD